MFLSASTELGVGGEEEGWRSSSQALSELLGRDMNIEEEATQLQQQMMEVSPYNQYTCI